MTSMTVKLTPAARLGRGLKNTALGPIDLTRGTLGVGYGAGRSTAGWLGRRYRKGRVAAQLRRDLAAAQEAVTSTGGELISAAGDQLAALQDAGRQRRPVLLVGAAAGVLAVGALAFSATRRSRVSAPTPAPVQSPATAPPIS